MKWFKVKTTDHYGAWEAPVSGTELAVKNKTGIYIRWPDKSITCETLIVVTGSDSAQVDMNNHPDHFSTRHLFIEVEFRGVTLRVPLIGLQVAPV